MNIKNKLRVGITFLFLLALLCSGFSVYYLQKLSDDSNAILKDNYNSLSYVEDIANVLDSPGITRPQVVSAIKHYLSAQQNNVTERGEKQLTDSLQMLFNQYKTAPAQTNEVAAITLKIRGVLYAIMRLNRTAIKQKGKTAGDTANHAMIIVSVIGAGCFMIGFTFMVNFPDYIAAPVNKLAEDMEEISTKNQAKTNFIATISHELKTPISSIKMSLQLLEDERVGHVNIEQRQLLENINDDTRRLLQITGELLDTAQIETGNIKLNFNSTHPKNIVDYAVKAIKVTADRQRVSIRVNCDDNLPNVRADLDKATWVLINLLSNAVKYSPENATVTLSVDKIKAGIRFTVSDTGKGIAQQYLTNIFDRYFKVPGSAEQQGTGLGLAIAKDFIEAQAGTISVQSQEGEGSEFSFLLPLG